MITKPTLLLDQTQCKQNIAQIASKAKKHGLVFRPHFKTHQSLEIGRWFKEVGVDKITVSSLDMAEYFAADWDDITVAFPVNVLEIENINKLAQRIRLNPIADNSTSVEILAENLESNIQLFIEVNVGQNRSGISPTNFKEIEDILAAIEASKNITFAGFLAHAGQSYSCKSKAAIEMASTDSLKIMTALKARYIDKYPDIIISLGDTPCFSVAEHFEGLDEMRPGNFVFYDLTQTKIGSNEASQIAVALACPVVSINKELLEVTFYGGGIHLSKDRMEDLEGTIFGRIAKKTGTGWGAIVPNSYVSALSQEHGTLKVPASDIEKYNIGDTVLVLPVHSCMTANLMKEYLTLDGERISMMGS